MMQNELFYSYIDDSDKELMAIEAAADIEINKSLLALEYADRLYDIKLMQADLKVLNESGTFEDLDMLYEAAGKENADRKEGIVKTIWNKILKFLGDMRDAIGRLISKNKMDELKNAEGNTSVKDPNKVLSAVKNAVSSVGKFLKPGVTVTNDDGEKVVSITKTLVTTIEGIGVTAIAIKTIPGLFLKAQSFGGDLMKKVQAIKDNPPMGDGINSLVQFFKTCADKVFEVAKSVVSSIKGAAKNAASTVSSAATSVKTKVTGNPPKPKAYDFWTSDLKSESAMDESVGIVESEELEEACDDIISNIDAILG